MEIWHKLISDGDKLCARFQFEQAKEKYLRALERSRFLYYRWPDRKQAVNFIIDSHEKLLECLLLNQQHEYAGSVILQAYRLITNLLSHTQTDSELYPHLSQSQKQLKGRIFELLNKYPEIEICDGCHLNIFGYSREYQDNQLYLVN